MSLPMDAARCDGGNCPSKKNCRRYTERSVKGDYVVNAALWLRREAGDSACDMVIWVEPVTTFKAGAVKAFLMADNPDDLRCAQWVIANGSAKRRDGDE